VSLDAAKFLRVFLRNAGPLAPVLVIVALVSLVLAAEASRRMAAHFAALSADNRAHVVELRREPITPEQALIAARRLAQLVPAVRVQVSGNSVVVAVANKEQVAEWLYALSVVQATLPNVAWEPRYLCLSVCEGGDAARAYVTAFRPRLAASN
jgi:hypothetical protein